MPSQFDPQSPIVIYVMSVADAVYVGQTKQRLSRRLNGHIYAARHGGPQAKVPVARAIHAALKAGQRPEMSVAGVTMDQAEADRIEAATIETYRLTTKVLNERGQGLRGPHSEASRERMRGSRGRRPARAGVVDRITGRKYKSVAAAARQFGIVARNVTAGLRGDRRYVKWSQRFSWLPANDNHRLVVTNVDRERGIVTFNSAPANDNAETNSAAVKEQSK